jgi:hypothetical protein
MRFVETRVFTELVCKTLEDDEYRALQSSLLLRPEQLSRLVREELG